ncbi:MAG: hypothetical protein WKF91_22455 [Segetibacter sp.]
MKQVSNTKNLLVLTSSIFQSITKKLTPLFFSAFVLLLAGCYKNLPIDFGPKNTPGSIQINFTEPNLFPEGVAYDPFQDWFYVSSASHGTVGIVTRKGTYTPFITDENLTGTTGLKVDKVHKRLWVCNIENGIGSYNLNTGTRIFYTDLTALLPGEPVFINDEALDPEGNAYVTNSASPVIYKVTRAGKASVFFQNAAFTLPPGEFGFNGIQYDGRGFLLVAFANQLVKIPVRNPAGYSIVQLDATVSPDGLLLGKDGKQLVVVSNTGGTPDDRVLSFVSNDEWKSGSMSTSFNTSAVFPTTATSDGKRVYVLYSHLDKLINGENQNTFTIQEVPLKKPTQF